MSDEPDTCKLLTPVPRFEPHGASMMITSNAFSIDLIGLPGVVYSVTIPEGYPFDGASIPRLAWSLIGAPFEPDFITAACVHDWICEHSNEAANYPARVVGDATFFMLLAKEGVSRWRRCLMYLAVRLNSFIRYGK